MGTNFLGLNKNNKFARFKIPGHSILFNNSYRKLKFCGYWNSWKFPGKPRTLVPLHKNKLSTVYTVLQAEGIESTFAILWPEIFYVNETWRTKPVLWRHTYNNAIRGRARGWQIPLWTSAFIGLACAFIVHNFIRDKWKARSSKSYENLFVSPRETWPWHTMCEGEMKICLQPRSLL